MKSIVLSHLALSVGSSIPIFIFYTSHKGLSLLAGSLAIILNFLFLGFSWYLVFQKKLIVLSISLIVLKYTLVGLSIYYLIITNLVDVLFFGLGVGLLVPSCVFYALLGSLKNSRNSF